MKKSEFLITTMLLAVTVIVHAESEKKATNIVVYRSPTCSCCGKWVEHLKQNNFTVQDIVSDDVQAQKNKYGVTPELASCHTAIVDGYVVEGHVPASDIVKMLETKPKIVGLAAPGMPVGTPGMEMGDKQDSYDVVSFDKQHQTAVFKHYQGKP